MFPFYFYGLLVERGYFEDLISVLEYKMFNLTTVV